METTSNMSSSVSFSPGDCVFVRNSDYPAKFVRMIDATTVQVEWPKGNNKWESLYPLDVVSRMNGRTRTSRQRKKPAYFAPPVTSTEGSQRRQQSQDKDKSSSKARRNVRVEPNNSSKRPTKQRKTRTAMTTATSNSNVPYQPRKLRVIQTQPTSQRATIDWDSKNNTTNRRGARRRIIPAVAARTTMMSASLFRNRNSNYNDDDDSDSSSDDELLEQVKRMIHQGPTTGAVATAKASSTTASDDYNSSDDDYDLYLATKKRTGFHTTSAGSSSSAGANSDDDRKPAARPTTTHRRRLHTAASEISHLGEEDDDEESNDDNTLCNTRPSESPMANDGSSEYYIENVVDELDTSSAVVVKREEDLSQLPTGRPFVIGDHVYVRDGTKGEHPAVVINVVNDWLEVKWESTGGTCHVAKSQASLMFDLTSESVDVGRPRRSTRARTQPSKMPEVAAPVKKEPGRSKKRANKKNRQAQLERPVKKRPAASLVAKPKKKRAVVMDDVSTKSAVSRTRNNVNQATLIESFESESDAESFVSEATFEYTAPGVDPVYQSVHIFTSLQSFMQVEPWKKKGDIAPNSSSERTDEASAEEGQKRHCLSNLDSYFGVPKEKRIAKQTKLPFAAKPNMTLLTASALSLSDAKPQNEKDDKQELLQQHQRQGALQNDKEKTKTLSDGDLMDMDDDDNHDVDEADNNEKKPVRLDSECENGKACFPYDAVEAIGGDNRNEDSRNRQSTETANPDDLPGILLSDTKGAPHHERETADSNELSRMFETFTESELTTQTDLV